MKNIYPGMLLIIAIPFSLSIYAADNISINYGVGSMKGKSGLQGINLDIMHQPNAIGIIGSATYLSNTDGQNVKTKYASILAGPSFSLSDSVFIYGMAGVSAASKMTNDQPNEKYGLALNTGVKYKIIRNVTINAGYEMGLVKSTVINIAYIGVGYSF